MDGVTARERGCAASPHPTRSWPPRGRSARRPSRRRCSRTRSPGSRPGGPAGSASWSAWTGSARRTSCGARRRRHRRAGPRPSCWSTHDRRGTGQPREEAAPTPSSRGRPGDRLDLDLLAQTESVFALSNGHIGLRGNLDEGEPHGLPGTYLNSFYELRPLPYAEAGYGYPESGQTIVNVTNGKLIRLLVDDEPFDVRYGELARHERVLDLRAGTLHRVKCEWVSPAGRAVRVPSTRLVSFTQRAIAAICYEVEPVDAARCGSSCSRSWWPTRQLPAAEQRSAGRGGAGAAAVGRGARQRRQPARAGPPHQAQRPADGGRRWTTWSTAPER